MLLAAYSASNHMSSDSKGKEREIFVNAFLSNVFPPAYRFGSGEIVDRQGQKSGQLDIVIEYPFFPSIPTFSLKDPRLYMADGVAAVIEVKSDVSRQWEEVKSTSSQVTNLKRSSRITAIGNRLNSPDGKYNSLLDRSIPVFAVGYTGWSNVDTIRKKVDEGSVDGILVIDAGKFVASSDFRKNVTDGPACLWSFISSIYLATTSALLTTADPMKYFSFNIDEG